MNRALRRLCAVFGRHTGTRGYGRVAFAASTPRYLADAQLVDDGRQLVQAPAVDGWSRTDYIRPTPRAIAEARAWLSAFPWAEGSWGLDRRVSPSELRHLVMQAWDHVAVLDAALRSRWFSADDSTDYLPAIGGPS